MGCRKYSIRIQVDLLQLFVHRCYHEERKFEKITIYRGGCKTPFEAKFALLAPDADFSQIAYGQQDMSICEKPNRSQNHQIWPSKRVLQLPLPLKLWLNKNGLLVIGLRHSFVGKRRLCCLYNGFALTLGRLLAKS